MDRNWTNRPDLSIICSPEETGRKFGTEVPKLVQIVMRGEMPLEPYINHKLDGLEKVKEANDANK